MPLDPQMKLVLEMAAELGVKEYHAPTVEEARARLNLLPRPKQQLGAERIEDRTIPGPGGQIPVRIYTPGGSPPFPVLMFFHGGGWMLGGLDSEDAICRGFAIGAGCVTVSVDYRLAPEHRFPAATEDCYAATCWVAENAAEIGGDPARVAVGGNSAGGGLATVVAMMARDRRGRPALVHQLLLCPALDAAMDRPSYRTNPEGYLLTRADMAWFWKHYLAGEQDKLNPYACPLRAKDLGGLPPAMVITAEFDPLRDEGEAYAARLRVAGLPVACTRYEGVIHSFVSMFEVLDLGKQALAEACAGLRRAFGIEPPASPERRA
ncbi:MAG: alpha/beta hydrolase [Candidatus Binataceae bacterium]